MKTLPKGPGRPQGRLYPHRLTVFLDAERQAKLAALATEARTTKAQTIRDLLDGRDCPCCAERAA
jgi:hypothetical protein